MTPIPLTNTGEMVIIPEEAGLTDGSELRPDIFLGYHEWAGCPRGKVYLGEVISGWTVFCAGCGTHSEIPKEVSTIGQLREFLKKELEK